MSLFAASILAFTLLSKAALFAEASLNFFSAAALASVAFLSSGDSLGAVRRPRTLPPQIAKPPAATPPVSAASRPSNNVGSVEFCIELATRK